MTSAPETAARPVRRPSFICVGAGKAGTTWLWEMLRLHPGIYLPDVKEIHYFNDIAYEGSDVRNPNFRKPVGWYLRFADDPGEKTRLADRWPRQVPLGSGPRAPHQAIALSAPGT